ncbi:MAG: PadR family transcriptional regulator [Victivallales bacterium]|nr:PadR family transcriptional regulator [Victivallales bacterium]
MSFGNWQSQLRKGFLNIVILNLLSKERCHGYEMVRVLRETMGLSLSAGNIYPILARLKNDRLIESSTEVSSDGPPRKYFYLTNTGELELAKMNNHWDKIVMRMKDLKEGRINGS